MTIPLEQSASQLQLEQEMIDRGKQRLLEAVAKARQQGREHNTHYGVKIVSDNIEAFVKELDAYLHPSQLRRGAKPKASAILSQFNPETVAFLTLQTLARRISGNIGQYRGTTNPRKVTVTVMEIGAALETEACLAKFQAANPKAFERVKRTLKAGHVTKLHRRKRRFSQAIQRHSIQWEPWSKEMLAHVGLTCLDLAHTATKLFSLHTVGVGQKSYDEIEATPETLAWIKDTIEALSGLTPAFLPALIPLLLTLS